MSHITSLLARPSTLGFIAVAGSGAFYIGMKSKTIAAKQQTPDTGSNASAPSGEQDEKGGSENKSYHVRAGERSGGGV